MGNPRFHPTFFQSTLIFIISCSDFFLGKIFSRSSTRVRVLAIMKKYMRISKFQNSNYDIAIHLKVIFTKILKIGNVVVFLKMRNSHFLGHLVIFVTGK